MAFLIVSGRLPRFALGFAMAIAGWGITVPARALDAQDFVVADDDGYGIADCMKPGVECGRVMADAWCEAHGHGHASAFGLAEDVTGSTRISSVSPAPTAASAVIIRCGE